jgi:hypothetical protein
MIDVSFCAYEVDIKAATLNEGITRFLVNMSPVVDPIAVTCRLHSLMPEITDVCFVRFNIGFLLLPPF